MMTKVVRFHEFGGPEVLRFESLEVGEPGAGEVRVRVEAIGLNRAEAAFRSGRYIERAVLPARLGYEAAGIVEALGEGVKGYSIGEPICVMPSFSMNKYGVYAEHAIVACVRPAEAAGGIGNARMRFHLDAVSDRLRRAHRHFSNRSGRRGGYYRGFQQRGACRHPNHKSCWRECRLR